MRALEQALGAALVLVILADVFLTVLYARIGTGILAERMSRLIWQAFRAASKGAADRGRVLSFGGPTILVSYIFIWSFGLSLGAALIMHPALGSAIRSGSGETPTDFVTALYAGGSSMAIVGSSDFKPQTAAYKLLYLFNSLVGMSVTSLTITYLMQVYSALRERNTLGLKINALSAETGDAAELVARLGPKGQFSGGYNNLSELAAEMTQMKEAHHFYPVLFYFRFRQPYYSVSRFTLVALDAVTLIRTALADEPYGWLKEAGAVEHLRCAAMLLVTTLEDAFLPDGAPERRGPPARDIAEQWSCRFHAALERLRRADIEAIADKEAGARAYVGQRAEWDSLIRALAPAGAYRMQEIDPAGSGAARRDPD